ncbi:hypothetical protein [Rhizobium sp. 9140]|uniref:hypothetical protein n=1 Tax=Rhizobium sp. 9140 TaxID=1761900 RepID=UPI00079987B8|nr:hypothetical protein [Rhizobium sp. 9140]CZT33889.1 hypothetical protein GA0004734_00009110 [Rhizobium sp. 9140]
MAWADRIRRQAGCLALLLLVAIPASHSLAKTCTPSGSEASRLQRQIASNMAMARNHVCTIESSGFACREIAGRIAQARAELAALPSACKPVIRTVREESKPKPKRVVRKPIKTATEAVAVAVLPAMTVVAPETIPAIEPTVVAVLESEPTTGLFMNVSLRGTKTDIPRFPRKVRMVGPAFLPEP